MVILALGYGCRAVEVNVGELICEETSPSPGISTLQCHFEVTLPEPSASRDHSEHNLPIREACTHHDDGTWCVDGSLRAVFQPKPKSVPGVDHQESSQQGVIQDSSSDDTNQEAHGTITHIVGEATYRPSYLRHGTGVAAVLLQAPSLHAPDQVKTARERIELAEWYFKLGNAHYPHADQHSAGMTVDQTVQWEDRMLVEVELSINAFQQVKEVLDGTGEASSDQVMLNEKHALLAMAHFQLGEAYFLRQDRDSIQIALDEYKQARQFYEILINESGNAFAWEELFELKEKYAGTCSRVGMTVIAAMDPMEQLPDWMEGMMDMMGGTGGESSHGFGDVSTDPSINTQAGSDSRSSFGSGKSNALEEAHAAYEVAIGVFNDLIRFRDSYTQKTEWDWNQIESNLAATTQHFASALTMGGDLQKSKSYFQQAIQIHERLVLKFQDANHQSAVLDLQRTQTFLADVYLSLSDTCTQLGDYDCAKLSYGKAMDLHLANKIETAPIQMMEDQEEQLNSLLSETQAVLLEYRAGIQGKATPDRRSSLFSGIPGDETEQYMYQKDDGYEGDLLSSLGTIYLSMGKPENAISYFEQAVEKYKMNKDDQMSPAMADLLINTAMAYYRVQDFQKSKEQQWTALDFYRSLYGDGVNPYVQGLDAYETMMMESMGTGDTDTGTGFGGPFFGNNKKEDSKDNGINQESDVPNSAEGAHQAEPEGVDETSEASEGQPKKVIDIDAYRRSIENATRPTATNNENQGEL